MAINSLSRHLVTLSGPLQALSGLYKHSQKPHGLCLPPDFTKTITDFIALLPYYFYEQSHGL
jgi:hypothetical protein